MCGRLLDNDNDDEEKTQTQPSKRNVKGKGKAAQGRRTTLEVCNLKVANAKLKADVRIAGLQAKIEALQAQLDMLR